MKKIRNNLASVFSRKFFQLIFTLILFANAGCTSFSIIHLPDWQNQDLRYIDPIDSINPDSDLIAVETRFDKPSILRSQQRLYLRLDFLSHSITSDSIYIFFDTAPGGSNSHTIIGKTNLGWEFYLVIRSNSVQVFDQQHQILSGVQVAVFHQTNRDYLEIAIQTTKKNFYIPEDSRLQIFIIANEAQQVLDHSDPISISALSPKPLNVMFVFWNTYPVTTPVQALRRWDGAHTGPLGARHGLYNLLRAAQSQNIPLVLLDLKTPLSLSALDFGDKLDDIQAMAALHQVILPDNLPIEYSVYHSDEIDFLKNFYQRTLDEFGFSKSTFSFMKFPIFNPDESNLGNHSTFFTLSGDTDSDVKSRKFGNGWLFEIPRGISTPTYQPSDDGLAIELKKQIITASIENGECKPKILAIGGDLPFITWGDYPIARDAFETIKHLPWVHIMSAQEMASWRNKTQPDTLPEPSMSNGSPLSNFPALQSQELMLVRNLFLDTLFPFDQPEDWHRLQTNLAKLLPAYTFVDDWAQQPQPITECPMDITGDGNQDCILANQTLFLWIDPANGGILFIYEKIKGELHQIIAPGLTLMNGQTDPSQWNFSKGIYIEKRLDNIALQDNPPYSHFEIGNNHIIFSNKPIGDNRQQNYTKLIQINHNQLEVIYQNPVENSLIIPLNLDPWHRFEKGWSDNYKICQTNGLNLSDILCWSYQSNNASNYLFVRISVIASNHTDFSTRQPVQLTMDTFKDTQSRLSRTEDPNQERPTGHFLPFPMSLIRIIPSNPEPLKITITISDEE